MVEDKDILNEKVQLMHTIERVISDDERMVTYDIVEDICKKFVKCYMFPAVSKFSGGKSPEIEFSYAPPTERELAGREAYYLPNQGKITMTIRAVAKKAQNKCGVNHGTYFNAQFIYRAIQSIAHEYQHFIQDILVDFFKKGKKIPEEFKQLFKIDSKQVIRDFMKPNNEEEQDIAELESLCKKFPEMKKFVESAKGISWNDKVLEVLYADYFCRAEEVDARLTSINKLVELTHDMEHYISPDIYSVKYFKPFSDSAFSLEEMRITVFKPVNEKYNEILNKIQSPGEFGE